MRRLEYDLNINAGCGIRKFINEHQNILEQGNLEIVYFGVDKNLVIQEEQDYISSLGSDLQNKIKIVYQTEINEKDPLPQMVSLLEHEEDTHLGILLNFEVVNVFFA